MLNDEMLKSSSEGTRSKVKSSYFAHSSFIRLLAKILNQPDSLVIGDGLPGLIPLVDLKAGVASRLLNRTDTTSALFGSLYYNRLKFRNSSAKWRRCENVAEFARIQSIRS